MENALRRRPSRHAAPRAVSAMVILALTGSHAWAQLVVTELMVNPKSPNDAVWEWIEVHNAGPAAVNLDGYIFGKINELDNSDPDIASAKAANTVIPAGGVAVLYDGGATGFDDSLFRTAWGLPPSATLIGVDGFPALSNSGDNRNVGLWPSVAAYESALVDDFEGDKRVWDFTGAVLSIDYSVAGFPSVSANGPSIAWNGVGDNRDGTNWSVSAAGVGGAVTSQAINTSAQINSSSDIGNPGRVSPGSAAVGLWITEVMYDPASQPEGSWEWIEIYNNTGGAINFGATPYVLQDATTSADLSAPNISSGVLAQGKTAVLFDSSITQQNMIDAWDPGGLAGTLFIPVESFPSLSNTGDTIAIWDSFADYAADSTTADPPRSTGNAVAALAYDDTTPWPINNNSASIYLQNLAATPSDPASWARSSDGDVVASAKAAPVFATSAIHPGGDVGSPGAFGGGSSFAAADFNQDGAVNADDLSSWKSAFGASHLADVDGDGDSDGVDFLAWQRQYSGASVVGVPEPDAVALALWSAIAVTASWNRPVRRAGRGGRRPVL